MIAKKECNLYAIKFVNGRYALYSDMEPEWLDNENSEIMAAVEDSPIFHTTSLENINYKCKMIKESYVRAGLAEPELWLHWIDSVGQVNMRKHGDDESLPLKPCTPNI